jgi:hypothetical protein
MTGGVAQSVSPEFKLQYHKKKIQASVSPSINWAPCPFNATVSDFRSLGGGRLEKDIHFIPLFLKLIAFLHKKNVSAFLSVKGIMSSVL